MSYYLYILKSVNKNYYYKGITNNLDRRLKEHFQGQNQNTKSKLPMKLIHVEICSNLLDAKEMEKYYKSGYGREIIKELAEVLKLVDRLP